MSSKAIFDFDTTCFTTSTIASTPIVCATPTPSFSPKRKYRCDENTTTTAWPQGSCSNKRQRLSVNNDDHIITPSTPLYRNFGNGLSLCNNTKTNRFSNIEEILQFLTNDDASDTKYLTTNSVNEQTVSDDIVNELMVELSDKNELPELNSVLLDLKDVLHSDWDFLL